MHLSESAEFPLAQDIAKPILAVTIQMWLLGLQKVRPGVRYGSWPTWSKKMSTVTTMTTDELLLFPMDPTSSLGSVTGIWLLGVSRIFSDSVWIQSGYRWFTFMLDISPMLMNDTWAWIWIQSGPYHVGIMLWKCIDWCSLHLIPFGKSSNQTRQWQIHEHPL